MCGLIPDPEVLIETVGRLLLATCSRQEDQEKIDDRPLKNYHFIESLCKELPQSEVDEHSRENNVSCYSKDGSFAFRPNRFYQGFYCSYDPSVGVVQSARREEFDIITSNVSTFRWEDLYRLNYYSEKAKMRLSSLVFASSKSQSNERRYEEATFALETLRLNRNPQILVCRGFGFPSSVYTSN